MSGIGTAEVRVYYACTGHVFVESANARGWEILPYQEAVDRHRRIIRCTWPGCRKCARQLDERWPCSSELTLCDEHAAQAAASRWIEKARAAASQKRKSPKLRQVAAGD